MRNRWARWVVLTLIVAFPLLLSAASAQGQGGGFPRTLRASAPILAVEMVLVGGLVFASRERRRLLVELDAARSRPRSIASPSAALTGLKMPTRRSVTGWVRR
jgi:hypothetical protein